jgi:hypothetical protein
MKPTFVEVFQMANKIELEICLLLRHDIGRGNVEDRGLRKGRLALQGNQSAHESNRECDHSSL